MYKQKGRRGRTVEFENQRVSQCLFHKATLDKHAKSQQICHQAPGTNLGVRSDPNLGTHPRLLSNLAKV